MREQDKNRFPGVALAAAAVMSAAMMLAGCNSSTQALDTAASTGAQQPAAAKAAPREEARAQQEQTAALASGQPEETPAEAETPAPEKAETATVIQQKASVAQKGTYIRAVVNGEAITNYDIDRRTKFRQLRRAGGARDAALEELVEERLKLQEAQGRGTLASDAIVDKAFADFAKSNRSTPTRISGDLDRMGVGAAHFKNFIRAQISWSRTVGAKMQAETRDTSQSEAIFQLRKAGEEKPETTEYQLQQIIFVVPVDKRSPGALKARKDEALAFRQRFSGCENSIQIAKELRDVAVKELGRLMEPELPPIWKDEVIETDQGGTTVPKETEKGIEVLAVCNSRVTSDDRAAQVVTQSKSFESLNEDSSQAGDDYLAELRKRSTIIYR
jgi:peptidyl-prolyl cis-trans isomerase SurA